MSTGACAPTLLYVEDEPLIQELVAVTLEDAGFTLLIGDSGEAALQLLAANGASISGVITDINLGSGSSGWDVARKARQTVAGLPIVYVSAVSEHEWTSEGVPGSIMIAKPFVATQIVVAISSLLVASTPTL